MIKLDECGKQCPIPVIETKRQLAAAETGETVAVLTDSEITLQNLKKFATQKGFPFASEKLADNRFEARFTVTEEAKQRISAEKAGNAAGQEAAGFCGTEEAGETVVVISSDSMGGPERELGGILLKGFLYALSKQDEHPDTILFYNGGARLTCEGSESLEDLQALADAGVKIRTCGTCLKYQKLEDKLKVGEVTNMYDITETMTHARKLIRP